MDKGNLKLINLYFDQNYIWKDCFPNDAVKFKMAAEKLLETDPESRSISNIGGYQSIDDIHTRDEFKDLVHLIETQANIQIHQELELVDNVKFTVINMWANINWNGNSNSYHCHVNPPSESRIANTPVISGVFYAYVPKDSGRIAFTSNKTNYQRLGLEPPKVNIPEIFLKNVDNPLLNNIYYYQPIDGDILYFMSDVLHGVEPSKATDNQRRISISFNLGLELK